MFLSNRKILTRVFNNLGKCLKLSFIIATQTLKGSGTLNVNNLLSDYSFRKVLVVAMAYDQNGTGTSPVKCFAYYDVAAGWKVDYDFSNGSYWSIFLYVIHV